ncbi:hypothetical protein WBP06_00335 [Novosphingobium sp. BL-8H]
MAGPSSRTFDQRGHGDGGIGRLPHVGTQPGFDQRVQFGLRHLPQPGDMRLALQRIGRGPGLARAHIFTRFQQLHGHAALDLRLGGGDGIAERQAGGQRNGGQRHHDRDHPGHRPGHARLRNQFGTAHAQPPPAHARGTFFRWLAEDHAGFRGG